MNESALEWLACPKCNDSLTLIATEAEADNVCEGTLTCDRCEARYRIADGIPRFLEGFETGEFKHWDTVWVDTQLKAPTRRIETAFDCAGADTYFAMLGLAKRVLNRPVERSVEIGCGSGSYSLLLRKAGLVQQNILVDVSSQALYLARSLFKRFQMECTLIQADGRRLPIKTRSCDLSISGGVIEHFRGAEQEKLVAEHCRIAEQVLCQAPFNSMAYWTLRLGVTVIKRGWPFGEEWPLSRESVYALFSAAGHQVVAESYHDWLTATLFLLSARFGWVRPLRYKTLVNRLFQHEILVYTVGDRGGP